MAVMGAVVVAVVASRPHQPVISPSSSFHADIEGKICQEGKRMFEDLLCVLEFPGCYRRLL